MKKLLITILAGLAFVSGYGQNEQDARQYAETITKEDLYDYLSILASDALEGRGTGTRGQKMAAAFIRHHFEEDGLVPPVEIGAMKSYYQPVTLYTSLPGDTYVKINDTRYENFKDIIYYGSANTGSEVTSDIVFAGKGTEEAYKKLNVKDKAVFAVIENIQASKPAVDAAINNGAKMVFLLSTSTDEEFAGVADQFKHWLSGGRLSVSKPNQSDARPGVFFISPSIAEKLFNKSAEELRKITLNSDEKNRIKPSTVTYKTEQKTELVHTENVLGYLEGTDKKEELLVITAHYDHIGRVGDEINNGADDDGSGVSTVIELAEAFVKAKKEGNGPRRSILFMLVTGEEKGLLGSEYYSENPIFPLENTVVNLNIDMIGRIDPAHKENPNYVYLVGSDRLSTELHEISEKANKTFTQFDLDYTYNDEAHPDRIYYRSDHWNFAKNNIPVIFYFNGTHDDYHQPTDTIEKIDFELLTKRAHLVFYTAWMIANRDDRPAVDKLQDQETTEKK